MEARDLVGAYIGRGQEYLAREGTLRRIETSARLVYTREGVVMAVSTPVDLDAGTKGAVAYAGRYDMKDGKVRHHIEVSVSPELVGKTLVRTPSFDGDRLTLTTDPDAQGGIQKIYWERIGPA